MLAPACAHVHNTLATHARTRTHTHTHGHGQTQKHTHTCTCGHAHHTPPHVRGHARTDTRTPMRAHMRTPCPHSQAVVAQAHHAHTRTPRPHSQRWRPSAVLRHVPALRPAGPSVRGWIEDTSHRHTHIGRVVCHCGPGFGSPSAAWRKIHLRGCCRGGRTEPWHLTARSSHSTDSTCRAGTARRRARIAWEQSIEREHERCAKEFGSL